MNNPNKLLEELDLAGGIHTVGRPAAKLYAEFTRSLTAADIAALNEHRGVKPKTLVRMHSSHHALAKCIASGMKTHQASLVTGYSIPYVSTIQNDPSFAQLVKEYAQESKEIFADMAERMLGIGLDALEILHERLRDKPEDFSIAMLLDTVKATADRTGNGPGAEVNLNVRGGADLIDRPPRETADEWTKRRQQELTGGSSVEPSTRPTNGSNNGRLVS